MKQKTKFIFFSLLFIIVCILLNHVLNYALIVEDDGRVMWSDYYNAKENIDYLYLGSSHLYMDIIPAQMDEINGYNNYSLGVPYQSMAGNYYTLREVAKSHNLNTVYVEMFYQTMLKDSDSIVTWRTTDRMHPSLNKFSYLAHCVPKEQLFESFLPFTRLKQDIFDIDRIKTIVTEKRSPNYDYDVQGGVHPSKGFVCADETLDPSELYVLNEKDWIPEDIPEESLKYLSLIIDFCKDNHINLVLFSSPVAEIYIYAHPDYDKYVEQINAIAEKASIPYLDFNLCREDSFPIHDLKYMSDRQHLSGDGAALFTDFLGHLMLADETTRKQYFYSSYAEKLTDLEDGFYGVIIHDNGDGTFLLDSATNSDATMEYKVTVQTNDTYIVIQDFNINTIISFPQDVSGSCCIQTRKQGSTEIINDISFYY